MIELLAPVLASVLIATQEPVVLEPSVNEPLVFTVRHDGSRGESLTGRVYVSMTRGAIPPLSGPSPHNPEPFFGIDVVDWMAGDVLRIDEQADATDTPPHEIGEGPWKAVAIFREVNDSSRLAVEGGLYSQPVIITENPSSAGDMSMLLDIPVPTRDWKEHKNLRLVHMKSDLLSSELGREITHGACVIVPDDYDPNRAEPYPVMYWIGGYGSDHYGGRFMKSLFTGTDYDDQICRVVLNSQCYNGHHLFADSANNGSRLTAFMTEFLPTLEETYNLGKSADLRAIAGHSEGGWAALWMLTQYPDMFRGVWSLVPSPIHFKHFFTCDIYEDKANMFVDSEGVKRPIARNGLTPTVWAKGLTAQDDVVKNGGIVGMYDWVFSPKGDDGRAKHLFNHESGEVDSAIAEAWKAYDILEFLKSNWETLAPKLRGKINVVAAEYDTFYLEGGVIELKEFFDAHDFDAHVYIKPDANHGHVFNTQMIRQMDEWFARTLSLTNHQAKEMGPQPAP